MVLYARPTDITAPTWTRIAGGSQDSHYPISNLSDRKAHTVAKSSTGAITYRGTFGGATAIEAIVFNNTNATAIQITNNAGLNVAVSIPATPLDGLHLDPWIDLRDVLLTTATTWDFAFTGPTGVAIGEILLIASLRSLDALWSPQALEEDEHADIHHRTEYGVELDLGLGVRTRRVTLAVRDDAGTADLLALQRSAQGRFKPWVLILRPTVNDALFVKSASDVRAIVIVSGDPTGTVDSYVHDTTLAVSEQQKGWL